MCLGTLNSASQAPKHDNLEVFVFLDPNEGHDFEMVKSTFLYFESGNNITACVTFVDALYSVMYPHPNNWVCWCSLRLAQPMV